MSRAHALPLNPADVTAVSAEQLMMPMRHLIAEGRGLALLNGLSDEVLRELETAIWRHFPNDPAIRLAVALRFRALVNVFASRRLKSLLLQRGFKAISTAISEAATQRLNARFGFKAQRFVMALDAVTTARTPANTTYAELAIAA